MSARITIKSTPALASGGLASIIIGVMLIIGGAVAWGVVSQQLADEKIYVSQDAPFLANRLVNNPIAAYSQAVAINDHALDASGGKTYAELAQDDPTRAVVMNAAFLRSSLFTSVVAFGVSLLAAATGLVFVMVGWALRRASIGNPIVVETDNSDGVHIENTKGEVLQPAGDTPHDYEANAASQVEQHSANNQQVPQPIPAPVGAPVGGSNGFPANATATARPATSNGAGLNQSGSNAGASDQAWNAILASDARSAAEVAAKRTGSPLTQEQPIVPARVSTAEIRSTKPPTLPTPVVKQPAGGLSQANPTQANATQANATQANPIQAGTLPVSPTQTGPVPVNTVPVNPAPVNTASPTPVAVNPSQAAAATSVANQTAASASSVSPGARSASSVVAPTQSARSFGSSRSAVSAASSFVPTRSAASAASVPLPTRSSRSARSAVSASTGSIPKITSFDDLIAPSNSGSLGHASRSERALSDSRKRVEDERNRTGMTGTIPIVGDGVPSVSTPAASPVSDVVEDPRPATGAVSWQSPQDRLQ